MNRLAIALGALLVFCGMDGAKAQTQVQPYYQAPPTVSGGPLKNIPVDTTHGLPVNVIGGTGSTVTANQGTAAAAASAWPFYGTVGGAALSATNGWWTNLLQGNPGLSLTNG